MLAYYKEIFFDMRHFQKKKDNIYSSLNCKSVVIEIGDMNWNDIAIKLHGG